MILESINDSPPWRPVGLLFPRLPQPLWSAEQCSQNQMSLLHPPAALDVDFSVQNVTGVPYRLRPMVRAFANALRLQPQIQGSC